MIVWINGTFGVGKTTTGTIVARTPGWRMFDPEHVGYMLATNLKDVDFDDFQELPPWRTLVPAVMDEVYHYTKCSALVAVQTVLAQEVWNELKAGFASLDQPVFHVVLDCETAEIRRRIEADQVESQAKEWRLGHLEVFERERDRLVGSADLVVNTTNLTPNATASTVIDAVRDRHRS